MSNPGANTDDGRPPPPGRGGTGTEPAAGPSPSLLLDDDLVRRIALAVDDHEVAVLLESDGVSDRVAAETFDAVDVFDLAARLRSEIPPAPPDPAPPRVDWYGTTTEAVLRGLTFTVAGLSAVGLAAEAGGRSAAVVVMVACALWIAVLQSLSFVGYLLIERGVGSSKGPRVFVLCSSFVVPVVVGSVISLAADPTTGLLAGAALLSLTAVVLLLVVGRPRLVAAIVLPIGLVSLASMVGGPVPTTAAVSAWAAGAAVLVVTCLVVLGRGWRPAPVPLSAADLIASVPYGVAGSGVGALSLITAGAVSRAPSLHGATPSEWLVAAAPFLIQVSLAEVFVIGVRRHGFATTTLTRDVAAFRPRLRRATSRAWLLHLGGVGAVALMSVVASSMGRLPATPVGAASVALAFSALGVVLVAALLLLSCDRVGLAGAVLWAGTAVSGVVTVFTSGWSPLVAAALTATAAVSVVLSSTASGDIRSYR